MIDVKNPTDERCRYIGVRSCSVKPEQDFYFGSCRPFKKWQSVNGTNGLVKTVLGWWPSREQAVKHEILLHDIFDVGRSKEFWNQAKQKATGFDTTGISFPQKPISEETRKKLSESHKGKPSPRKGAKVTMEQREKMRQAKLGSKHSVETKIKMSQSQIGRKWSDEQKQNLSKIKKGRKVSDETKDKLRKANTGRHHSEDTREKMSKSRAGERYYNNGIISIRCLPELKPNGFVNGLLRRKHKNVHA